MWLNGNSWFECLPLFFKQADKQFQQVLSLESFAIITYATVRSATVRSAGHEASLDLPCSAKTRGLHSETLYCPMGSEWIPVQCTVPSCLLVNWFSCKQLVCCNYPVHVLPQFSGWRGKVLLEECSVEPSGGLEGEEWTRVTFLVDWSSCDTGRAPPGFLPASAWTLQGSGWRALGKIPFSWT